MKYKVGDTVRYGFEELYLKGYRWLARTSEGGLYAFKVKPTKINRHWIDSTRSWIHIAEHEDEYQNIKFDDAEPTDILPPQEVIEELSRWDGEKVKPLSIHSEEGGFQAFKTDQPDNGLPHTPHYMNGHIETIDIIKMALTPDEFRGFLKGNVLKYELRAPYKHETPEEDYQKAKDYYDLLEGLE